ncbi:MAG: response regulator [Syntrophales bacterium]|nr:response regulator [Syntrophales bacterium]
MIDDEKENPYEILVVDDSPTSLQVLTRILTYHGYRARPASSALQALRSAAAKAPDLILLDVKMPVMDGFEVCRRLKSDEQSRDIPVLFISALDGTADKVKGFEAGGVDYITKPFDPGEVLARVRTHLQLSKMADLKREIAERKRAEEALRRTEENFRRSLDDSPLGVRIVSAKGQTIYANRAILDIYGCESIEELKAIPVIKRYTPESFNDFQVRREKRKRGDYVPSEYEVSIVRKDGGVRHLQVFRKETLWDGERQFQVIYQDITERKQAEESRRKLENQLIQAQKLEAIGTLAGGIAHDFNNILSGIMGYSELSLRMVQDLPKAYRNMEQVLKAAERAKDLVRQILTFSRKAVHEKKPTALSPLVDEVVKFMRASLPTTIEMKQAVDVTSDIIMADPTQLHQVLINLCTNAGYAMRETGGVLEISLEEVVVNADSLLPRPPILPGHHLILTVRDTGLGISHENLARIFDPYFTTKEKGEGTGLGLAVVHGIVKDHGGEIRVYSEVGRGTIFRVYLPLMEKQAEGDKALEEALLPGKGETILFIDDEKMVVDLSKELLQQLGYRIVTETDPVKAIEVFKEGSADFDLVITDKTMPHMTGFDVAREVRRIRADIPVILSSGFQEREDLEKLTALGISRLITKPIRMRALAKTIREILDEKRIQ